MREFNLIKGTICKISSGEVYLKLLLLAQLRLSTLCTMLWTPPLSHSYSYQFNAYCNCTTKFQNSTVMLLDCELILLSEQINYLLGDTPFLLNNEYLVLDSKNALKGWLVAVLARSLAPGIGTHPRQLEAFLVQHCPIIRAMPESQAILLQIV